MTTDSTPPATPRDLPAPVLFDAATAWNEIDIARHDGYRQACQDIAAGHAELAATWRATGRATYEQRVANRIAEMAETAAVWHARHGTTEWPGLDNGAVLPSADWDTTTVTTIHHGRAA